MERSQIAKVELLNELVNVKFLVIREESIVAEAMLMDTIWSIEASLLDHTFASTIMVAVRNNWVPRGIIELNEHLWDFRKLVNLDTVDLRNLSGEEVVLQCKIFVWSPFAYLLNLGGL